jgi:hypothetical protein
MRTTHFFSALVCITAGLMASCSSEDSSNPEPVPPQSGELLLVAIDTAKVIRMTETGTNPVVTLNRLTNTSSYFSGLSISPDAGKIAYGDYQTTSFSPDLISTRQIRVMNADGTDDHIAYEAPDTSISFGAIRFLQQQQHLFCGGDLLA